MRQIWIPRIGGPEVMEVLEAPDPEPGPGEVRIRVAASGVNFADVMARMGLYPDAPPLPAVVGYECAGTIDVVGPDVSDRRPGEPVVALCRFGAYSDTVVVPAMLARPVPKGVDVVDAAAVPVTTLTAWLMLVRLGNVQADEWVLIHGAGGGVGLAAVQIAKLHGAHIIGTASKPKHDRLRERGVDFCIDPRREDFVARVRELTDDRGVRIALDPIGGRHFRRSLDCLGHLGRLFMFGVSTLAPSRKRNVWNALAGLWSMPWFHPVPLMNANQGVIGINLGHLWDEIETLLPEFDRILSLVAAGPLAPVVHARVPFDHPAEAHRILQDRENFGKVLLVP